MQDLLEVFVDVIDDDGSPVNDDEIDNIIVPLGGYLQANAEFGPNLTYYGACGRAQLQLRIRVTSECPETLYGPNCSRECVEVPGQRICNYLGDATCLGNFAGESCYECTDGFYGANCDRFCKPINTSSDGHYTCDDDGNIVCLPGYTDNTTACIMCEGNLLEPDCSVCDKSYYPHGVCDTFCEPRDDSTGHYTCTEEGLIQCHEGYTDTSTNCTVCSGNFKEPDCTECDDNFQGSDCTFCKVNYYPTNNCSVLCVARNDSEGHYTCDPFTGNRVCLEGYKDASTNCVTTVKSG